MGGMLIIPVSAQVVRPQRMEKRDQEGASLRNPKVFLVTSGNLERDCTWGCEGWETSCLPHKAFAHGTQLLTCQDASTLLLGNQCIAQTIRVTFQREQVGCQETSLASRHGWHQSHPTTPLCAGHLSLGFPGRIWAQGWQGQICSLGTLWVNGALQSFFRGKKVMQGCGISLP